MNPRIGIGFAQLLFEVNGRLIVESLDQDLSAIHYLTDQETEEFFRFADDLREYRETMKVQP